MNHTIAFVAHLCIHTSMYITSWQLHTSDWLINCLKVCYLQNKSDHYFCEICDDYYWYLSVIWWKYEKGTIYFWHIDHFVFYFWNLRYDTNKREDNEIQIAMLFFIYCEHDFSFFIGNGYNIISFNE